MNSMHEFCPVQEEVISKFTPLEEEGKTMWYINDGFKPENTVVGWADIGTSSRPITRQVVGRVADSVVLYANGSEKVKVRTYVRSYKGDYPLSLLGGKVTRSWENETYQETELTQFLSREYAVTLSYSHFAADRQILTPGVEMRVNQKYTPPSFPLLDKAR